jgi:SH3-like domain-containing protein
MNRTLKATLIAATVLLGTTAGAFAASYAWADGKVKMKDDPWKSADTIEILHNGDKVKVFHCFENDWDQDWCKVRYDGETGYVRLSDLDFHHDFDDVDVEFEFGSGGFEVEIGF